MHMKQFAMSNPTNDHKHKYVIGFNHGLPWCVKYMARGPTVTTKPNGEAYLLPDRKYE